MNKNFSTNENGIETNHTISKEIKEIYGDGLGPAMIGYPNVKFSLFQQKITPPDQNIAEREIVATVTIPTIAILELASRIRDVIETNKENFSQEINAQVQKLLNG